MSVTKSDLLKQLNKTYPHLLKKDLSKFFDMFIEEIKIALKNNERVEIRGMMVFFAKIRRSRNSRNPKSGNTVFVPEKKIINFKMGKNLYKKINEK